MNVLQKNKTKLFAKAYIVALFCFVGMGTASCTTSPLPPDAELIGRVGPNGELPSDDLYRRNEFPPPPSQNSAPAEQDQSDIKKQLDEIKCRQKYDIALSECRPYTESQSSPYGQYKNCMSKHGFPGSVNEICTR